MSEREPIFFGVTRSFLLGVAPALMTLTDVIVSGLSDEENATFFANLIAATVGQFFGWSAEEVQGFMLAAAPIFTLIVAQQRAHAARPYTLDITKLS